MDFLLKQFGINPEEIKKQIGEASEKMSAVINHFNARIDALESKIDLLNVHIARSLGSDAEDARDE